ncbi:T9SS type A sorting domain-containing protein [Aquimarina megaterium]|uniref:T9SS type A sorting domain-containing protein n=1 Tax=Aquimarina megaterium TaxID=1443666 RepID=UPI00094470F8|nr:T9SS type A sorting domain-containing protein [Aquimarina megaterium]
MEKYNIFKNIKALFTFLVVFQSFCTTTIAQTIAVEPSALSKADIALSMRFYDYLKIIHPNSIQPAVDHSEWIPMASAFYANRLLWTYKKDSTNSRPDPASFFQEASGLNYPFQYAMPLYIPWDENNPSSMVATNLCDFPTRGSWEVGWSVARPDVNSDLYYNFQLDRVKKLIDEGNISFQQDSPSMNEELVGLGGSFSTASMNKFNLWLQNNLSPSQITALGIADLNTFNYKDHLLNTLNSGLDEPLCNEQFIALDESPGTLKYYYREFQKWATIDFYTRLHNDMNTYIGNKYPGKKGTYSANNLAENHWLKGSFDFWDTEVYPSPNGNSIAYDIINHARFSRSTHYTATGNENTSAITIASTDLWTNQVSVALGYATGLVMIAPWDVYYSSSSSRYYGDPTDFTNLFSLIRNNETLFNDYNTIEEHVHVFDGYEQIKSKSLYPKENPDRVFIKLLKNSGPQNIPKHTKVKIGETVFSTSVSTGVGQIYLPLNTLNSINVGDKVWYIEFPDGTRYFDDTNKLNSSYNPDIDITSGLVTHVLSETSPNRTTLYWTDATNGMTIPKNSKVIINNKIYTTTVHTGVGNIYLPPNTPIDVDEPVWYIEDPDGNIIYPQEKPYVITARQKGDYKASGTITNVISEPNPNRTTVHWTGSNGLTIPKGSEVLINDKIYKTIVNTGVGSIYLPENTPINLSDPVWYIKDPLGNIIYPEPSSGIVTNVLNDPNNNRTIIHWSDASGLVIPSGSKVLINNEIHTTTGLSNVGNIYLKPNASINIGDHIWHITNPDGTTIFAAQTYNNPILHIINLTRSSKKVIVKVAKNRFSPLFDKTISPENQLLVNSEYSDIGSHYLYKINNLNMWAILAQNSVNGSLKSNTTSNTEDVSNIDNSVVIYPNPNSGEFMIQLDHTSNSNIKVFNSRGQKIYAINTISKQVQIDLSKYPKGVYFVKIKTSDKVYAKKIILK